ncbi:MAG: hypothetical protein ACN6PJ_27515 [Achromobacter sp.]|uniref:hypothetical protein n=1 Tax=Achromobacter sp. TaxID=134375 RepID=UPI003D06C3EF
MSETLKINVIAVLVRRDAQTTTQTTVALHEAGLLRSIYGKENVTGAEVVAQRDIDPNIEQNRLVAKYGPELVEKVFGDEESGRLLEALKKAAADSKAAQAAGDGKAGRGGRSGAAAPAAGDGAPQE